MSCLQRQNCPLWCVPAHWQLHSQGRVKDRRLERTWVDKLDPCNYFLLSELARSFSTNLENSSSLMNWKYFTWNTGVWSYLGASILSLTENISSVMVGGYSAMIYSRFSTFPGQVQNQGTQECVIVSNPITQSWGPSKPYLVPKLLSSAFKIPVI